MNTRVWNNLPEGARQAAAIGLLLLIGAVVIGALRLSVSDRTPATLPEIAQAPPIQPIATPNTPPQEAQPAATSAPVEAAAEDVVEMVFMHDISNPASAFTASTSLSFAQAAVIGRSSNSPGCYLIDFGNGNQAWTCDQRITPANVASLRDYTPPAPAPVYVSNPAPVAPQPQVQAQPADLVPIADPAAGKETNPVHLPRPTTDPAAGKETDNSNMPPPPPLGGQGGTADKQTRPIPPREPHPQSIPQVQRP